ncbi:vesicle-associated membrane protein 2 isoform X2 [Lucilia cuprina]|uniref:vesicle-associated membrane protein 2 isoform X2 n=1 Tax=Lucilia cuprina TaxID=7375 RepID=UPI001F067CB9|nr:vesicle-associated membrane protein 2 isoform X2 [Lucilia cuprina]
MGKKDKKKEEADPAPAGDAPPAGEGAPAGEGGDGEIVGGPRNPQQIAAQKRLQQTQAQVDEVVDIMRTNVEKVLERDQKLSELDDRADALQQGASQFEQQAGKLKRKFWLQNLKMMIIMGVIGLVIVGIIANKLGLIGGEQQPQYPPQYYMPPPPPQQQPPPQAPAAGGTSSLVGDDKTHVEHGGV